MRMTPILLALGLFAAVPARAGNFNHFGYGLVLDYMPPAAIGLGEPTTLLSPPALIERLWSVHDGEEFASYVALDGRLVTMLLFGVLYMADTGAGGNGHLGDWLFSDLPVTPLAGGTMGGLAPLGAGFSLGGGLGGEAGFTATHLYVDTSTGTLPPETAQGFSLSAGPTLELTGVFTGVDHLALLLRTGATPSWVFDVSSFAAVKSYSELQVGYTIGDFAVFGLVGFLYAVPLPHEPSNQGNNSRPLTYVRGNYGLFRVGLGVSFDLSDLVG